MLQLWGTFQNQSSVQVDTNKRQSMKYSQKMKHFFKVLSVKRQYFTGDHETKNPPSLTNLIETLKVPPKSTGGRLQ